ncbi:hypothetical protein AC249_AIPGENE8671, partial [Exaiptasia diaphana]
MSGTFLCPNTCGFAKVLAVEAARHVERNHLKENNESPTRYRSRQVKELEYKQFQSYFTSTKENKMLIGIASFSKNLPSLRKALNQWNTKKLEEKNRFFQTFSLESWEKLSIARKNEHTFANCKGCAVRYAAIMHSFPVKSRRLKGKAKANPVFSANLEAERLRKKQHEMINPTQADAKRTAKAIYQCVSPQFEKVFKQSLAEALSQNTELNLQHKTKAERRKERRDNYRKGKENIEAHMKETSFL